MLNYQLVDVLHRFILHNRVKFYSYLAISTTLATLPEPKIVGGTSASNAVGVFSPSFLLTFVIGYILSYLHV